MTKMDLTGKMRCNTMILTISSLQKDVVTGETIKVSLKLKMMREAVLGSIIQMIDQTRSSLERSRIEVSIKFNDYFMFIQLLY